VIKYTLSSVGIILFLSASHADEKGKISGKIEKPETVKSIIALLRDEKPVKYEGKIDPKTGQFNIPDLPLGKQYDLVIDYGSARLEGANMRVPKTDYVDGDPPLTKADEEKLKAMMKRLSQFEDTIEFMAIGGNVQHAAVLVNKLRTKPFVDSKPGECIWRLEMWHFTREEPEEAWVKVQDTLFIVYYRERLPKTDYDKKSLTLDPKLGGLEPTEKQPKIDLGTISLPDDKPAVRIRNAPVNPEEKKSE
jgi:hypothetical protein